MAERISAAGLRPLFFGRLTRVLFGLGARYLVLGPVRGDWLWMAALGFLGVSFLAGSLLAHPGCEITVLPNLLLSPEKRLHCF